jgi:hypothetical protein
MDHSLVSVGAPQVHRVPRRVTALLVGLALAFATLIVVQHRADAAPNAAVAAVALPSADAGANAQIDVGALIRQIVCPILIAIRNAFAAIPFFAIAVPILNDLIVSFGCGPSGTP